MSSRLLLRMLGACAAARAVRALANGRALTPPMGFVSWQRFRCNIDCAHDPENCISEHLYKSIADALVSEGYAAAGYTHVNMDDCWESFDRDSSGRLQPNSSRFPSGIPHLAAFMKARGLSLGIYTSIEELSCAQDTPGMTSQPGAPHYQTDTETLVSWGVSSLKLDKCGGSHSSGNVSYPHVSRLLLSAAQRANSTPIMLACSWPDYARAWGIDAQYKLAAEHCNLWRVFDDIDDKWSSLHNILEFYAGNASLQDMNVPLKSAVKGSYWSEFNFNGEGYRTFLEAAGPGHFADADMLMVGNAACPESNYCLPHAANATEPTGGWPCSHGGSHTPGGWPHGNYDDCGTCMHCDGFSIAEEASQLVLWATFASPFYLSADPRPGSIRPASKALLLNREIIAVQQDRLGVQGRRVFKSDGDDGLQLWRRELESGAVAAAVHVGGEHTVSALPRGVVDLRLFGFAASDRVAVRELVRGQDLGGHIGAVEGLGPIEAHGSLMLLLWLNDSHVETLGRYM